MSTCVLAIDQGTTGTTALVVDQNGRLCARAYREIRQFYPQPGWVEHDAGEIFRSVVDAGRQALKLARVKARELAAVGLANQRETFVVWERATGRPLHRAIVWQCRRSAAICEDLRAREAEISERTGLLVDPYFAGTKLKWLLEHDRALRRRADRGELCFGTIDSWLVFKLSRSGAFITDFTNASRTLLMNLAERRWDPVMVKMLGIPDGILPRLVNSRGPLAEVAAGIFGERAIPIGAVIGDQQAALYGQGCVRAGETKVTYGTGAFVLTHTGAERTRSHHRLLATAALDAQGKPVYALEGSIFIAGAAIQWLRDELGLIARSIDSLALARRSRVQTHPYVVPAFVGLGAPYWDSAARGAIVGITRDTSRADIVRATLDSIAYQVHDVIGALTKDLGRPVRALRADGGAAANDYLMQFQADLLGRPLVRPAITETTALGAGLLAGLAIGVWRSTGEVAGLRRIDRVFRPSITSRHRVRLLTGWRDAVSRVTVARQP